MDGGAWWAAVHGVAKSRTQLSNFTFTFHFHVLEKEMANPLQCSFLENSRPLSPWGPLDFLSGEGSGTPLQYSCLENPMDGGAW